MKFSSLKKIKNRIFHRKITMSNSRIRFLPAITDSGLREFLYPSTLAPMNEELPSSPPAPLHIPESAPNIPPSPEFGFQCHHLATKILTSSDPTSRSRWVHELTTLTHSLAAQLSASKNALRMEAVRTHEAQAINEELRKNLAVSEEALATTVTMLTVQTEKAASARSKLRRRTAEIHAKDLEVEKMREAAKQSIYTNVDENGKTAAKFANRVCCMRDSCDDAQMGVPPCSGEGVEDPVGRGPQCMLDSGRAHITALKQALSEKTQLLKAEERRAADLRKLLNSALEEAGLLKSRPTAITGPARSPLREISRYGLVGHHTPTGQDRQRLKYFRPANSHRHSKKTSPEQMAEWIFGEKAEIALSTATGETGVKGAFTIGTNGGNNVLSLDGDDPFVGGGHGKRYMTFPPELAPKPYRPGAGRRWGNAIFAF